MINPTETMASPDFRRKTWRQHLVHRWLTGVLLVLPALVTLVVIYQLYLLLNQWLIQPVTLLLIPQEIENQYWQAIKVYVTPPLSLLLVLLGLYAAGVLFQTRVRSWIDWLFSHVPGISTIYKAILDVSNAYQGPEGLKKIDQVVLVPFPHAQSRMAGYLMSECVETGTGEELVCVYLPLGLFPPTGYTVLYRKADVIITNWEATEGWKILLSAGLTLPPQVPFTTPGDSLRNDPDSKPTE